MIGEFFGPRPARFRSGARGGDGDSAAKTERMIPMSAPANFTYQAGRTKPRRVVAKVEWHPGKAEIEARKAAANPIYVRV